MNWTKASAIAEIASSAAILITLVYLVIEIGQNTAALQADSRDALLDADVQHLYRIVDDPELWLSYSKPDLSEAERARLFHYLAAFMRMSERAWFRYQSGALDETAWRSYQSPVIATLSFEQTRKWWLEMYDGNQFLDPEFAEYFNTALEDVPILTRDSTLGVFD